MVRSMSYSIKSIRARVSFLPKMSANEGVRSKINIPNWVDDFEIVNSLMFFLDLNLVVSAEVSDVLEPQQRHIL